MTNEVVSYTLVVVVGLALGVLYWGGLWWTCRRITDGNVHPGLMGLSYFLRLGVTVGAMWVMGRGSILRLAIIVACMLLVRLAMTRSLSALEATECPQPTVAGTAGEKEGD